MADESVEVAVGRSADVQPSLAQVVDGFVVDEESYVTVLHRGVSSKDGVVWLHDCS